MEKNENQKKSDKKNKKSKTKAEKFINKFSNQNNSQNSNKIKNLNQFINISNTSENKDSKNKNFKEKNLQQFINMANNIDKIKKDNLELINSDKFSNSISKQNIGNNFENKIEKNSNEKDENYMIDVVKEKNSNDKELMENKGYEKNNIELNLNLDNEHIEEENNAFINKEDENKKNHIELNLNPEIENKYISFNQNNFTTPIVEEDEESKTNINDEYNDFCLIPNKELYKICGTNSDISDINQGIFDKNKLNKYMTYPFDETNIFIVLKQPKESVKNRIINNIKERIKNKKINKSNKSNRSNKSTKNTNFIEIKNNKEIEPKNLNNNFDNHKYHIINNSKDKYKNSNNNPLSPTHINEGEIIQNNRKYKVEKIIYPNDFNNLKIMGNNINENMEKNKENSRNNNLDDNLSKFSNISSNSKKSKKNNIYIYNIKEKEDINVNNNKYIDNAFFFNSLDERIEQIRESLNSINVIDTLTEQAGLQCYKGQNNNEDELYFVKAKNLNQEFYDNLDIKFNEIEDFLNGLENK